MAAKLQPTMLRVVSLIVSSVQLANSSWGHQARQHTISRFTHLADASDYFKAFFNKVDILPCYFH